jgi:hypothetical protein
LSANPNYRGGLSANPRETLIIPMTLIVTLSTEKP